MNHLSPLAVSPDVQSLEPSPLIQGIWVDHHEAELGCHLFGPGQSLTAERPCVLGKFLR